MKGKEILNLGMTRRIGNGRDSLVFGDNWIPNFPPVVLKSLVVKVILGLPRGREDSEDSWYWCHAADGGYSVKSGYREGRRNTIAEIQNISNEIQHPEIWRAIWKAPLPVGVWISTRGALCVALKLNLWLMPLLVALISPFFWKKSALPFIWNRRNEACLDLNPPPLDLILKQGWDFLNECKELSPSRCSGARARSVLVKWAAPPFPLYKVNSDASFIRGVKAVRAVWCETGVVVFWRRQLGDSGGLVGGL
ncbi:uncharacterized protein G2W53_021969 [Senna tora]|uniref:Uncharacterized protein n=1 Tax=Senna tora TaxID=362788 RepID=A0A834TNJ1_9FABA|nr:uncharacterized protein G2W53_021969 [Senna tora]